MVDVRPFQGVRYNTARFGSDLSALVCPPYDVISPSHEVSLRARDPRNMVRLELPSADGSSDLPGGDRYDHAARTYRAWLADETFVIDREPALYAYTEEFGQGEVRRGLMAELRLEPWERREVRPHEETHAGPKRDRLALIQACRANLSPIWCVYQDPTEATARLWASLDGKQPDMEATDDDGVAHKVWVVSAPSLLRDMYQALNDRPVYIADGHHRYETALHYQAECNEEGADPDAGWNFALTYFVEGSDPGLVVLGTHRLIHAAACEGLDAGAVRACLERRFDLVEVAGGPAAVLAKLDSVADRPAFGVWSPPFGLATVAVLRGDAVPEGAAPNHSRAWRRLDLAALHALVIDELFPQRSAALFAAGHLEYTREWEDVEGVGSSGPAALAFLVRPTPIEQVMAVADAGDRMPEKSTYFYPKPATGFVIARCDEHVPRPGAS